MAEAAEKTTENEMKAMTLRLPAKQAKALEKVAEVDEVPVSQAVRDAIDEMIERKCKDKEFQARLDRILEEDREILDRLAGR